MNDKNMELERINRNITRVNLICLLGILLSLKSKTQEESSNTLLKIGGVLVAAALLFNGVCDLIGALVPTGASGEEV